MNKKTRVFAIITALIMVFTIGCDKVEEEPVRELKEGVITYESGMCESIINTENSGSVATASASNGAEVYYSVAEDQLAKLNNAFGGKLSISADGTICGKYDSIKKIKIEITASAEKCESVTAEITISVVNAYLNFKGRTLIDARLNIPYAASVAYVENEGADVTYRLSGSLPKGLSMDSDGTIIGVPTVAGPGEPFTVIAKASGYSETRAEFSIDVVLNHVSEAPSKIVNFGSASGVVELATAYVGLSYVNQTGICGKASALNNNNITYSLVSGNLPEGFTLYENGALFGKVNDIGDYEFTVKASAYKCEDVTCNFKLSVMAMRVRYNAISGEITKGENTNYAINTAVAGDGVAVTYSMTEKDKQDLKNKYGIEVTPQGYVTGVPTTVVKQMFFDVTASAEGYTSTTATMCFRINEPLQAPANGKFEAEYVDLTGKSGTGWSASPTGENLIDSTLSGVSNGAFVNYMHNDSITLEFVIYAEEAITNASLYLALGSEIGNAKLTPSVFGVYTYVGNKAEGEKTTVNYGSVTISGGETYTEFKEYKFGTVNLSKGWNVIQIAVHKNELRGGLIGGPGVDYLRVDTNVSLKWVPCTYNMAK